MDDGLRGRLDEARASQEQLEGQVKEANGKVMSLEGQLGEVLEKQAEAGVGAGALERL